MDYITPAASGVSATQWDFSDPMNNLQKRNKMKADPFNRSFNSLIYLFIYLSSFLILIGCKEVARWLSEAEGVSGAEARVITATLRSRNNNLTSFISLGGE